MAKVDIFQMEDKETGHVVAPITIYDAVVNPINKKTLDAEISELGSKIFDYTVAEGNYNDIEDIQYIQITPLGVDTETVIIAKGEYEKIKTISFLKDWSVINYITNVTDGLVYTIPAECNRISISPNEIIGSLNISFKTKSLAYDIAQNSRNIEGEIERAITKEREIENRVFKNIIAQSEFNNIGDSNQYLSIDQIKKDTNAIIRTSGDVAKIKTISFLNEWSIIGNYIIGVDFSYYECVIPVGCNRISISFKEAIEHLNITFETLSLEQKLENEVMEAKKEINEVRNQTIIGKDRFIVNDTYISYKGIEVSSGGFSCTDFIPYVPATIVYEGLRSNELYVAGVSFYDANKLYIKGLNSEEFGKIETNEVPSNACYVRFTTYKNLTPKCEIYSNESFALSINDLRANSGSGNVKPNVIVGTAQSLENGESISFYVPNIKNNKMLTFYGNITSFSSVTIRIGGNILYYRKGVLKIDNTNIYIYSPNSSDENTPFQTYAHNLDIAQSPFVLVNIECKPRGAAKITVSTLEGSYVKEVEVGSFYGCIGNAEVTSDGSYLTQCELKYTSEDLTKDTWMYGDSYFDYWTSRLTEKGFTNFLNDGHSGRKSSEALASLQKELEMYSAPKRVLWCMGMNDADSTTSINDSWKTVVESLVSICKSNNIELILCTIPTCLNYNGSSSIIHDHKNLYIKNSGIRYVDVANVLGADRGSDWYDGLRNPNDIHPSNKGAEVIALKMMCDVPELK